MPYSLQTIYGAGYTLLAVMIGSIMIGIFSEAKVNLFKNFE